MWQCTHHQPPCPFLTVPSAKDSGTSTQLLVHVMSHCNVRTAGSSFLEWERSFPPHRRMGMWSAEWRQVPVAKGEEPCGGGKTDNSSMKQGIDSQRRGWLLTSPRIQWDDAAGPVLPEWSEGSSRWGKLPLPFSIFWKNRLLLVPGWLFRRPWLHACLLTRCKWLVQNRISTFLRVYAGVGCSEVLWSALRPQQARDASSVRTRLQAKIQSGNVESTWHITGKKSMKNWSSATCVIVSIIL